MPRIARIAPGGIIQHVLNRGNGKMKLFHKSADYAAFVNLLADTAERIPGVRLLGYCLMPNHWHLVLWPRKDGQLSDYMRWLSNTHVRRWHQHRHSTGQGHIYQGRFKSFPVQDDLHLLTLLRYVESNPLRADLVRRAENWRWSSLSTKISPKGKTLLTPWPVDRPTDWIETVNERLPDTQLSAVRESVIRGRPLGEREWSKKLADRFGLGFTLRPRGRPSKEQKS